MTEQIHLIVRTGPEWEDPISAYEDEGDANKRASDLNAANQRKTAIDRLSLFEVRSIPFLRKSDVR